ncbi:MAG: DNA cytosine methyltransferase [Candidatus Melainabacteria bacterium]|nr:DNA cytosine methyltransferase [Candidatus Melainabacteria bacterium]
MVSPLTAIELFSGIGAFAEACRSTGIKVVAAYDQNEHANKVYKSNFGLEPIKRNLESLGLEDFPQANIWWMSPPCTPFSRRGERKDDVDPRSQALAKLIEIIPQRLPDFIFLENVEGFIDSKMHDRYSKTLAECGYQNISFSICSSTFGVPMRRPRFFIAASRTVPLVEPDIERFRESRNLPEFLTRNDDHRLFLSPETVEKYRAVLNIVDPHQTDAYLICFTRGYFKCRKASGSLIQLPDGIVRFVAPDEIIELFGFSGEFRLPEDMPLSVKWRLVGNSVDVRAIRAVLSTAQLVCR